MEIIFLVWLILWLFNSHIPWPKKPYKDVTNSIILIVLIVWLVLILLRSRLYF